MQKVIAIIGPTGVGKTALSIRLAKKLHTEIISGDSIQVYRGLDIGSAKVTPEEMDGIKHHLIDIKNLEENYSVYDLQQEGRKCIETIADKGVIPIVCGGTGLYIKALLYDYEFMQSEDETDLSKYDGISNEVLHKKLEEIDPISAEKIHMNNRRRVIRALEIFESNQVSKSELENKQEHEMIYDAFIVGLTADREYIYSRINKRVDVMVNNGLLNEINMAVTNYENPFSLQGMRGIGYKEFEPFVNGTGTLEECIESVKTHSRQFAKRQYTWFRNQMNVNWYDISDKNWMTLLEDDLQKWMEAIK